jgi:hypothetical protein
MRPQPRSSVAAKALYAAKRAGRNQVWRGGPARFI